MWPVLVSESSWLKKDWNYMGFPTNLFEPEHVAWKDRTELHSCVSAKSKLDELLC